MSKLIIGGILVFVGGVAYNFILPEETTFIVRISIPLMLGIGGSLVGIYSAESE